MCSSASTGHSRRSASILRRCGSSLYVDRTRYENERATLATAGRQALAQAQYEAPTAQIDADPRIAEVEKETAELTCQIEAISEAIDKAEQAVIEVVYEHREAWMEDVDPKVDDAHATYTDALAALVTARAKAAEKTSLLKRRESSTRRSQTPTSRRQDQRRPLLLLLVVTVLTEDAVRP